MTAPCTINNGCNPGLSITSNSNAYVYSSASSTSCTFKMTCTFTKISPGYDSCTLTSNNINLSFSYSSYCPCLSKQASLTGTPTSLTGSTLNTCEIVD